MNENRIRDLKLEKLRRLRLEVWKKYPMVWLRERMNENPLDFQWSEREGYTNHSWDGDKDPLASAWDSLADSYWVGVESATGTGKTYWLARVVLWFLDCFEDCLVVTSAPKQDQLKLHLWAEITRCFHKFKKIRPHSELYKLRLVVDARRASAGDADSLSEEQLSESWQAVGFVAGTGADEQSATKAQGFHRKDMLIIMEECPGMASGVMTAFQNTSTGGHNLILSVGNPDSEFDPLHQFCVLPHVKNYRVSAFDHPNIVESGELFPGATTLASIDRRRDTYGEDSGLYQSRVRGVCPKEGKDSLIRLDWINQCIGLPKDQIRAHVSYNAVGVDVAASETGDKGSTVWGKEAVCDFIAEFKCPNASHLAYNLINDDTGILKGGWNNYNIPTIHEYSIAPEMVGIDSVGVGVSTLEAMEEEGYTCTSLRGTEWKEAIPMGEPDKEGKQEPLWAFQSLRGQMYWEAREDFRLKRVSIDPDGIDPQILNQLRQELTAPKVELKSGKISVESKEDLKKRMGGKSPNVADAFVYWNWVRKGYRYGGSFFLPFGS